MVFRGKPSKACQRCRDRRLRCDLKRPTCSSCIRVDVKCFGYRDINILRINDQTQEVRSKTLTQEHNSSRERPALKLKLAHLPVDLEFQARGLFFSSYIADFSQAWDFLYPYFDPRITPEHLTLSIDAVSLAFFAHHTGSPFARNLGRSKYIFALKKTNAALQNIETAQETTTLEASLLLDLFERIIGSTGGCYGSQYAHANGALALVKLRGLEQFEDDRGLKTLARLSLNVIVCCLGQSIPIPVELFKIREHVAQLVNVNDPKWRMTGIVMLMTNLVSEITKGTVAGEERIRRCAELDKQLERISLEAPPIWSYERVYLNARERKSSVLDDFFDVYEARSVTQMWNVLRLCRIILCEQVVESCAELPGQESKLNSERASTAIGSVVRDICASVPQMTDCEGAARNKLPPGSTLGDSLVHRHTFSHFFDTYILMFALYVACWSRNCPDRAREWMLGQLERIAHHFGVKEAASVVEILRSQDQHSRVGLWHVYRLLGSYAFAA